MTVSSSCYGSLDDQTIVCRYSPAIDAVAIDVGSGTMYIPVPMAAAMLRDFTTAVETALRAQVPVPADEAVA